MANFKCAQSTVEENRSFLNEANGKALGDQLKTGVQNRTIKKEHHNPKSGGQCLIASAEVVKSDLQNLEVSQSDANQFESQIREKWHDSYEVMKANEIPTENIDEYLNHLKEAYEGVDVMIDKSWNEIKSSDHIILENKFTTSDNSGVRYYMIAFSQSPDGMFIDCTYVSYKMDFQRANKLSMFEHFKEWFASNAKQLKETCEFEIKKGFTSFLRMKALQRLMSDGHIKKIKFIDSGKAITNS